MSATPSGPFIRSNVWHLFDAKNQVVGRLASKLSLMLQGKHKPNYQRNQAMSDNIVVVNTSQIKFTGRKWDTKLYRHHTGWVGGLKEIPALTMLERHPDRILRLAVSKMLPKNKLRRERLANLRIYATEEHPYTDKFPLNLIKSSDSLKWSSYNKEAQHFPNDLAKKDMD